jgi:glycine/D-amino acid oxidase-like deaminating enzyme
VDTPFWLDEPTSQVDSGLQGEVDVAIIGAGITGVSCALALARGGLRVRVHDSRGIAAGQRAQRRLCSPRRSSAVRRRRETYGAEAAKELWQRSEAALDRLEAVAGDAFRRTGSLRLAADDEERDEIRSEFEALREDGFDAEWRWQQLTDERIVLGGFPATRAPGWPQATRATATFSA